MKNIFKIILIFVILSGCRFPEYYHQPGGPYYFKTAVTYQGYCPTGEITKAEADKLAGNGYTYYIVYFKAEGKPVKIFKVYKEVTTLVWQDKSNENELQGDSK